MVETPGFLPAHLALAGLMTSRGDTGPATDVLSGALALAPPGHPLRPAVIEALIPRLADLSPAAWHARLDADVRACLAEEGVDRQALARLAARLLLLKDDGIDVDRVASDPLWLLFLERCLNLDPAMEARLDDLRRAVAEAAGRDPAPARLELAAALGLQALAGEYLAPETDTAEVVDADTARLLAAMTRPLSSLDLDETTADRLEASGPVAARLIQRGLRDPLKEAALAAAISALTDRPGADAVSVQVRDQYEASPYPRWIAPPAPRPVSLSRVVGALPGHRGTPPSSPRVLVAGCGAGYEPIELARMDSSSTVTALDLSRASLAYGARMAGELGVAVRFVQGDILDLSPEHGPFDVVTCTGVLHHMEDPAAGLARLVSATRPGGVLRLALYSERARAPVVEARALIAARGWAPSPDGIRAFRQHVLAQPPETSLTVLRQSDDFYSLSGCRDLVFHVIEHRYTPPQVGALIAGAGLRLIGFDAPPYAADLFRRAFGPGADPLDLTLWDRLEAKHPTLFPGMFQFWCQAPA